MNLIRVGFSLPAHPLHIKVLASGGDQYLVAPVLWLGVKRREVYLPRGKWRDVETGAVYEGSGVVSVETPIETMPVPERTMSE